jgi:hypothetical protein
MRSKPGWSAVKRAFQANQTASQPSSTKVHGDPDVLLAHGRFLSRLPL